MRKLLAVLAAISLVLAATTYTFWHDREDERARADALEARVAVLESQRPANQVHTPPPSIIPATAAPSPPALQSAIDLASGDSDSGEDERALRRQLLRDPKYYEVWRENARLEFAYRRDQMIREMGVPPAKADEMVEYWIDRRFRNHMFIQNPALTEQEQRANEEQLAQLQREDDEKWRAVIGEEYFARMQGFEASHPSRNRANQLRALLATGNDALRDDQLEPLIAALHTERTRYEQEIQDFASTLDPATDDRRKTRRQMQDLVRESHRRIHSSAAAVLSSKQLAELDAMLRKELERMQAESALHVMEEAAREK